LDTSTPAFPAVPLKNSGTIRDLPHGGNRLFHAEPERVFIPKIALLALSITSISDKIIRPNPRLPPSLPFTGFHNKNA
jgi:hypothetical protein